MNIRKSYIMLFLIVLVACSDKNGSNYQDATTIEYKDFASTQKLVGKVFLSDKEVLKPMRVYVCDTILVTMNPMEKKLFHLFDLNSKRKIGQRISLGQGPNEMIRPSIIKFDENQIIIFDVASFTLFIYDTADFISNENTLPVERRTLELQAYGEIGVLADCLIGSTYNPKNQFVKFNNAGNKVGEFGYYPVVTDLSYTDDEKLEAFKFSFVTNMKDRIAVCYKWTDLIDIYDQNGQLKKRIHGPDIRMRVSRNSVMVMLLPLPLIKITKIHTFFHMMLEMIFLYYLMVSLGIRIPRKWNCRIVYLFLDGMVLLKKYIL